LDVPVMRVTVLLFLIFTTIGCSNKKMTLDCKFVEILPEDHPGWMVDLKYDRQFIWYKNENHLQGSSGSVTPYRSENDFNVTFEKYFPNGPERYRTIELNKIKNTLLVEEFKLSGMKEFSLFYKCEKL
tara:strand:- start:19 stop:402 length:384 start_codon:yes stop_codon:yes gene_type:complete